MNSSVSFRSRVNVYTRNLSNNFFCLCGLMELNSREENLSSPSKKRKIQRTISGIAEAPKTLNFREQCELALGKEGGTLAAIIPCTMAQDYEKAGASFDVETGNITVNLGKGARLIYRPQLVHSMEEEEAEAKEYAKKRQEVESKLLAQLGSGTEGKDGDLDMKYAREKAELFKCFICRKENDFSTAKLVEDERNPRQGYFSVCTPCFLRKPGTLDVQVHKDAALDRLLKEEIDHDRCMRAGGWVRFLGGYARF